MVAGVAEMDYRRFVTYNVVGGILWVWSTSLLGYSLGRVVPDIDRHIHMVIVVVVFLSILPGDHRVLARPPRIKQVAEKGHLRRCSLAPQRVGVRLCGVAPLRLRAHSRA